MVSSSVRPLSVVALAFFVGLFFTGQTVFIAMAARRPIVIDWDVWQELLYWSVWALLAPRILALAQRWPLDGAALRRSATLHAIASIALAVAQTITAFGLHLAVLRLVGVVPEGASLQWMMGRRPSLVWGVFMGVPFYWAVVGLYTVLHFRGRSAMLEGELARSQLDALRSQLRPHFLFNTLNAISVLTVEDPDKARRMVVRLGSLLRRSLDEEEHQIPLQQELTFLDDYLDIQRVRFGDRLVVTLTIDPAAADARVPVLMLQPLVENAIEHGAPEKDATTSIALRAHRGPDTLRLSIEDNGPGLDRAAQKREGIGLTNTRERLRKLYGDRARIDFQPADHGNGTTGTRVDITIPLSPLRA
jgi:two-component system, LytTR family, sensor kinase